MLRIDEIQSGIDFAQIVLPGTAVGSSSNSSQFERGS